MGEETAKSVRRQSQAARAAAAKSEPVTALAGASPKTIEEARELTARVITEVMLAPESLRRYRRLLRDKDSKVALGAWQMSLERVLGSPKEVGTGSKPTQVIVNSFVNRPAKDVTPVDAVAVEVRG